MPGYLVNGHRDGPLPIPGTDRTVTFKAAASYGDDLHVDVVAAQHAIGSPERTRAYVLERTVVMVLAWDLVNEAGQPLPITPDTLAGLSKEVGNFLAAEARKRFEGRPAEAQPPFSKPSPEPSRAARPPTPK